MIELMQVIILALIQGLTEFLPVSSSGHLVLTQYFLGTHEGDVFFDIILHCGTLGSVLVVYRKEIQRLLRFDQASRMYILCLVVGTIPAVLVGFFAKDFLESLFHSPLFAGFGLIFTALVLASTRLRNHAGATVSDPWEPKAIPLGKAFIVGIAQACAILPGVSRSGSTIATSLWVGISRAEAARFSFLLSIPAIAGALLLQVLDGGYTAEANWLHLILAALAAFLVGLLAIRWTALAVVQAHFWKFSFYCLAAGLVVVAILS